MAQTALKPTRSDPAARSALAFLQALLRDYHPRNFSIEFWDGTVWGPEESQFRRFTWTICNPSALRSAFVGGDQLSLAEAYIYGDFDIDGDIAGIFPLTDFLGQKKWSARQKVQLSSLLLSLPVPPRRTRRGGAKLRGRLHSRERDRQAVSYHYDVSNDFFGLWLGPRMVYSCAYFKTPQDDLDTAQTQKLDYICRKLRLKPGERLLDIGCGWGGLAMFAAREYGAQATGITLSQQQLALARERISQAGLADRCEVKLLDYRDLNELRGYDKIASVGMVEHVGEAKLREYFDCAYKALRPGGVFLCHGIGVPEARAKSKTPTFGDVYVFPDGDLVPIGTTTRCAESAGFEVRDIENLREHYALTLHHWVRGMDRYAEEAKRLVDEVTRRTWRLHMAGSAHYFQTGRLDLYQTVLAKPEKGRSGLPLTRADWYSR